jgi:FixJ family two-component response regulator
MLTVKGLIPASASMASAASSTVFVVDDDAGILIGLSRLLRAEGFGVVAYQSPRNFLEQHDHNQPGCLLLDVAMPELSGLDLQEMMVAAGNSRPIVFMAGNGDVPTAVQAMKLGAVDFLTKPLYAPQLVAALREALRIDILARSSKEELASIQQRFSALTPREVAVLKRVIAGYPNKRIASEFGVTTRTIKAHRGCISRKMGTRRLVDLMRFADKLGISSPS